ncbi:MAG TPA: DUF1573 domain-containing protein [Chitinophagaceae bacterium]|nr:DUF1573 domain-containing protein [Chitinophagaceae bacterium]
MRLMKSLFFLLVVVGTISSCKNNYTSNEGSGEKVASINDSTSFTEVQWLDTAKDLGTITEGQKLEVSFRFRNAGNKPLVIERVQPSCGCTVVDPPKEAIAPGKEGEIKGVFDSNGRLGPNHKSLMVYANTKQPRELVFNVIVNKKEGK